MMAPCQRLPLLLVTSILIRRKAADYEELTIQFEGADLIRPDEKLDARLLCRFLVLGKLSPIGKQEFTVVSGQHLKLLPDSVEKSIRMNQLIC